LRGRRIRMCFKAAKMSLSDIQRRNLMVKFCLENPNKRKSETVEYYKLLEYKKPTSYCTIKRFQKQENVERKVGSGQKCALSLSKARAVLKKQ
jgi:hypothetical protein